jgi:uncharacterized protein
MSSNGEEVISQKGFTEKRRETRNLANRIFRGPNGIRAGWRSLIFLSTVAALMLATSEIVRLFRHGHAIASASIFTPMAVFLFDGPVLFYLVLAGLIMARIERRKFSQYGLTLRSAFGRDFWIGAAIGFVTVSTILAGIFAFHGFRLTGFAIHGSTIATSVAAWSAAFALVGLTEEFAFRGYLQYTLTTGMGFWPAALVLSALFAFAHAGNSGESKVGLLMIVAFGLLHSLFLRRTGNLWLTIGFHSGYDWTTTFFYGVSDSGAAPYHNLLNSHFGGPNWLTGGTVGPEASVFTPIVFAIVAIVFSRVYTENRYRTELLASQHRPVLLPMGSA